jgi:GDPmannose 4,6-dehydratase
MDKKIALITGSGMDSKTLAHILLSKDYDVVLTYRRNTSQNIENIKSLFSGDLIKYPNSSLSFEFCDITDQTSVRECIQNVLLKFNKIDELYSLASQSHVGDSFKNALYTLNATGTSVYYLLETLRELSPKTKFYQASTSEMFGGDPKNNPFNEKSPFELRSPYSIAKNLAYNWCQFYRQTYGMFISTGFLFNHSNIYRNINFYCRFVTNSAAQIALGKMSKFSVGNINHYRDEHLADYGCEAMFLLLQLEQPEDVVVGNGIAYHGEEYLDLAFGYFNLDWKKYIEIDKSKFRANEVVKLTSDSTKAQKLLGWKPNRIPFKDHLHLMAKYDYELESGLVPVRPNVFDLYPNK